MGSEVRMYKVTLLSWLWYRRAAANKIKWRWMLPQTMGFILSSSTSNSGKNHMLRGRVCWAVWSQTRSLMFVIPPPYPLWFIPPLGFPSPSLLNTNEFLETLMLQDSRGLTRNTDHLWALLRTNTWPSFFTGLGLEKKFLHSCPLLLLHSWWSQGEPSLFVC